MPELEPLILVEEHPEWFFRSGKFDTSEMISLIVQEAVRGGANSIDMRRDGLWVSIAADVDWLNGDLDAFFAPQSYSEGGHNSSRVEVALTAFCDYVITAAGDSVHAIRLQDEPGFTVEGISLDNPTGRTIAFVPPS